MKVPFEADSNSTRATNIRVFPCPQCGEFINTDLKACRYCQTPISAEQATASAEIQEKVAKACNEASLIRLAAFALPVLFTFFCFSVFVSSTDPSMQNVVDRLFGMLLIGIPVGITWWLLEYKNLSTKDPDYYSARRNVYISGAIWLPIILIATYLWLQSQ